MFSRSRRLRSRQDISRLIQKGRRIRTPHVLIYIAPSSESSTRVACVVGKKVHASAVKRHFYQRRLREIAKQVVRDIPQPYDMVWVALPSISSLKTQAELRETITSVLSNVLL